VWIAFKKFLTLSIIQALMKNKSVSNEKKKLAMSVLVHSMQTDKLCTIVQCHNHGGNAQDYWKEILQVVQHSRDLELKSLHAKLVTIQFDNWPTDLVSFLLF